MKSDSIEEYLNTAESKSVTVLLWLLKNRDRNNQVVTTLDKVADECDVTKVTVNRIFQRLYSKKFLTKVRNGLYQLHKI